MDSNHIPIDISVQNQVQNSWGHYVSNYMSILTVLATGSVAISVLFAKSPSFRKLVFSGVNRVVDTYLDFKYRNYQAPTPSTVSDYAINHIQLISGDHLREISLPVTIDLRSQTYVVSEGRLQALLSHHQANFPLTEGTLVLFHYTYGGHAYVLPVEYHSDISVNFPLYSPEDIDSCLAVEYDEICTPEWNSFESSEYLLAQILKFSGPKGNFHCDTKHPIKPSYIIVPGEEGQSYRQMVSNSMDEANLKLKTMMGTEYTFRASQPILDVVAI